MIGGSDPTLGNMLAGDCRTFSFDFNLTVADTGGSSLTFPMPVATFQNGPNEVSSGTPVDLNVKDDDTITYLPITIAYVYPELYGNSLAVSFSTETEMANAGFNIYAIKGKKWIKLNDELIKGSMDSMMPVDYQVSLDAPEDLKFRKIGIAGVGADGKEDRHGPFKIGRESGSKTVVVPIDWRTTNKQVKADKKARKAAKKAARRGAKVALKDQVIYLDVSKNTVYRVTHDELLAAGINLNGQKVKNIAISFRDEGVARHIENDKKGKWTKESTLEFMGTKISGTDSLYLSANKYQLSLNKKLVVESEEMEPVTTKELVFEVNKKYGYATPGDDPFYDDFFYTKNSGTRTFIRQFNLPSVAESSAEITVHVSALSVNRAHQLQVSLNGTEVANLTSYGRRDWPIKIILEDNSILSEGSNEIRLTATGLADGYDIYTYDKLVYKYDDKEIVVSKAATITLTEKVSQKSIKPKRGTNYVIISHPMFMGKMLDTYISQRQSEGWKIQLVNVEDIYTAYGHGMATPDAIKSYLQVAEKKGVTHVQLVGASNHDYRDYLGLGSVSFIPSIYVFTNPTLSYTPSDTSYVTDANEIPQMAIGRWPARTMEELEAMVNKTLSWKSSGQSASHTALFIAGEDEESSMFAQQMDSLAGKLETTGGWSNITRVYLDDLIKENNDDISTAVTEAREKIIQTLNDGASILAYSGHSSPSKWATDGLLRESDITDLIQNEERTAITLPMACYGTYVETPAVNTMAHQLLSAGENGAVAVYGATLFSTYTKNGVVTSSIIDHLLNGETLGEAVLKTKQSLGDTYRDEVLGASLLGDVTIRVR